MSDRRSPDFAKQSCKSYIFGLPRANSSTEALQTLHWAKLYSRREMHRRAAVFKNTNGLMEVEFNMKSNSAIHSYSTRGRNNLYLPKVKTNGKSNVLHSTPGKIRMMWMMKLRILLYLAYISLCKLDSNSKPHYTQFIFSPLIYKLHTNDFTP